MASRTPFADDFLSALEHHSGADAVGVLAAARAAGGGVGDLVHGVVGPSMREVGVRWERDEWSVADEHAATVLADSALSAVTLDAPPPSLGSVVVACPEGEWHALPARMVAEALRGVGWEVAFLGASVPEAQLERFLLEHRPDAVLLSTSMIGRLPSAAASVAAARAAGVPAVLGGAAVRAHPGAAAVLGAHLGPSAVHDVDHMLRAVAGTAPLPTPHRAAAEAACAGVLAARGALRDELVSYVADAGLAEGPGGELFRACAGELVDVVAAGALLGDDAPVGELTRWLEGALQARGVGPEVVDGAMRVLAAAAGARVPRTTAPVRRAPWATWADPADEPGTTFDVPVGLLVVAVDPDGSGRLRHASAAFAAFAGRTVDDLHDADVADVVGRRAWSDIVARHGEGEGTLPAEVAGADGPGRPVVLHWSSTATADDPSSLVIAVEDVGNRRHLARSLGRRALHDPLTGLANRSLFLEHLEQARRDSSRTNRAVAVVVLDVDGVREVNERYGSEAGDELLVTVAHRLRRALRVSDVAGRLGGDEFVVVCPALLDEHEAALVAERMIATVTGPCLLGGQEVVVSVAIGLATARSSDDVTPEVLLHRADEALRRAQQAGPDRYVAYDAALDAEIRRRDRVVAELRQATAAGQLQLRYQPVVDLTDGRVLGAEALLRWEHPVRGLLLPEEFLAVAEDTGAIVEMGPWVLAEACARFAEWRQATDDPLVLSVNVSARQLGRGELASQVNGALEVHAIDPASLRVEVTETALTDSAAARQELWELDNVGVHVGIDDFGTGYASLTYLRQLPVRFLKIDRSFVAEMMRDPTHHAIVRSVADLAGSLGIAVVAEGIETAEQSEALLALGCTVGQGFLHGGPMTAAELGSRLPAPPVGPDGRQPRLPGGRPIEPGA